jgi:hypothetical protein
MRRHPQTTPLLQKGAKQHIVIQDQIARLQIAQKGYQKAHAFLPLSQHSRNEIQITFRKLHPAIGMNYLHIYLTSISYATPFSTKLYKLYLAGPRCRAAVTAQHPFVIFPKVFYPLAFNL